jgi:glutaminyl-tRNA synthetase
MMSDESTAERPTGLDFIRASIAEDVAAGRLDKPVTRFPPEPNGYLHIGHAKSICLNFGIAQEYGSRCHLRFDDTNPVKEDQEYVDSIQADVRWLGFDWGKNLFFASDYFEQLYQWAEFLIEKGLAYVDSQNVEEMRKNRGSHTEPGTPSPFRERSVAENLALFRDMRAGKYPDGAHVLRAKIDLAAGNMNLRDPVLYRIRHAHHHRTGDRWCIYPSYDFAHGQSDAIEGITHSLCTLEFEDHRPLYDWFIEHLPVPARPHQTEFARLNLTWTVLSKRRLIELVQQGHVKGWDDPRMPTLAGLRRRGFPASAIRDFCDRAGVSRANSTTDIGLLQACVREELNRSAPRAMGVLDPVKLVITNYPAGQVEEFEAENNPENPAAGTRQVPFSGELWIDREDFAETPPPKWFRLAPGKEVRLKHAYYVTVREVVKDAAGNITELRAEYDPQSRGGGTPDGRKVKGTIHWVSAAHAARAEVRLYDHLFNVEDPGAALGEGGDIASLLNPGSLKVVEARIETALAGLAPGAHVQFLRVGYFVADPGDHRADAPVFNRVVGLKDGWARVVRNAGPG